MDVDGLLLPVLALILFMLVAAGVVVLVVVVVIVGVVGKEQLWNPLFIGNAKQVWDTTGFIRAFSSLLSWSWW